MVTRTGVRRGRVPYFSTTARLHRWVVSACVMVPLTLSGASWARLTITGVVTAFALSISQGMDE